jgi:hypothetical protein
MVSGAGSLAVSSIGSSTPPDKRWGAAMTYDAAPNAGYLLLFSGSDGSIKVNSVSYGDTWTYQSGIWTDISQCTSSSCPEARTYAGMSYYNHSGKQYVVLFGGQYGGPTSGFLRDTWIFNGSWHNVTPMQLNATNSPPALYYPSMAWDPVDRYAVLYGGCVASGCNVNSYVSDQTWAFEGLNATNQPQWVQLTTPVHPPGLYSPGLTFDSATNSVLLFGGVAVPTDQLVYTNQTWSYTAATGWVNLTLPLSQQNPANTPPTRVWMTMAYDPVNSCVVLFGGQMNQSKTSNPTLGDTWTYSHGVWTNITATLLLSPHARFGGVMAYDASDSVLVLFGGLSATLAHSAVLDDVWWFNGTPGNWVEVYGTAPSNSTSASGLPLVDYLAIVVVVLLVAVGIVVFLLRRRSRARSAPATPPLSEVAPPTVPPPSPPPSAP